MTRRVDFLLGLPALRDGALWRAARRLDAPVLISANALSRWRRDALDLRDWIGFETRWMHLVGSHPVALDSAGFVAARRYRGFPWSTDDYLDLAASAPWFWWASQDWCVEPEIAHNEDAVLDRISGTIRLNRLCLNGAERRAITDRFVPVIQGWHPGHYLRCIERMPFIFDFPLIGVGSMCRRHVDGAHGVIHVLDVLDRAFAGSNVRLHLFGLKSQAIAHAMVHPRVASCDSQAYGMAARQDALKARVSKSDQIVARTMTRWYLHQVATLNAPSRLIRAHNWSDQSRRPEVIDAVEARVAAAAEELRTLHERGEIEWTDLSPQAAFEFAFLDDD